MSIKGDIFNEKITLFATLMIAVLLSMTTSASAVGTDKEYTLGSSERGYSDSFDFFDKTGERAYHRPGRSDRMV